MRQRRATAFDALAATLPTALIAWGAFAFGAVYAWAFVPLMIGAVAIGALGILQLVGNARVKVSPAFAPVAIATVVQTALLPKPLVAWLSPSAARVAATYDPAFPQRSFETLSVATDHTLHAVIIAIVLACLAWGASSVVADTDGGSRLARNVAVLGTLMGILAIVQKATFNGKIYWFWESEFQYAPNYYGPFINRNHFAGWMILVVGFTGGYLCGLVEAAARKVPSGWRERLLWLSTPAAGRIIVLSAAVLTMCISLVWSMSRSGIAGCVVALSVLLACARGRMRGWGLTTAAAMLLLAGVGALAWKGPSQLAAWYGTTATFEWRIQLWRDSLAPLKDFWLTGSGLNTYRVLTLIYPMSDGRVHAVQAHNDYLQLAIEGGVLVGVPVIIAAIVWTRRVLHGLRTDTGMTWWLRLGAAAGIAGICVQELTDFSLQIPGVAVLFAILLGIAGHTPVAVRHSPTLRLQPSKLRGTERRPLRASV